MDGVYDRVFAFLTTALAEEDAFINKQTRTLSLVRPEDLGVASRLANGLGQALQVGAGDYC